MNQVATQNPQNILNGYFEKHKGQLAAALPKHLNPDRMSRLALTAFSQNKAIARCDPKTIFASVIVASQLGLEIGVSGQGYLVPYKNTCTFIPGWQGYVDLVSRSGRASIWTGAVFEGDEFDWQLGTDHYIKHKPMGEDDPEKLTHVYAVGEVKGGTRQILDVWPIAKVWKHRDKHNKVGAKHYSFQHPEMYARKIPLLQVIKYLPKSVELQSAMEVDLNATQGKSTEYIDGEFMTVDIEPEAEEQVEREVPPETVSDKALNPQQVKLVKNKLTAADKAEGDLCEAFGVESIGALFESQMPDIQAWIEQ